MQIIGETQVVASLYPLPTEKLIRDYVPFGTRGGYSAFQMLPSENGMPVLLTVADACQVYRDPADPMDEQTKNVDVRQITKDLVMDHWYRPLLGAPSDCGPAIWVSRVTDIHQPNAAKLIAEESAIESPRQKRYWEWLYRDGQSHAFNHQFRLITHLHRVAGQQLGMPDEWASNQVNSVACFWCHKMVSPADYICGNCQRPLREPTEEMKRLIAMYNGYQGASGGETSTRVPAILLPTAKDRPQPEQPR